MPTYAYLRRSRVTSSSPGTLSWDVQEAKVKELAERYRDTPIILSDWGRSGRSTDRRPGYQQLLTAIDSGQCTALYSYSLSRLARSVAEYVRLAELCRDHHIPMRLAVEGELDYSTPTGRFLLNVLASFAQMEGELAQERARDTIAIRRERGDRLGKLPYGGKPEEDAKNVIDAYLKAGSYRGAALLLNRSGIPARSGIWWPATVKGIVAREAPSLAPVAPQQGRRARGAFIFAGLVRCPHCAGRLTGRRRKDRHPDYHCARNKISDGHPAISVKEPVLIPWMDARIRRLHPPTDVVAREDAEAERTALIQRRERIADNYAIGLYTKQQRDMRLSVVNAELEVLDIAGLPLAVGPISWDAPAPDLNATLRTLVRRIVVDPRGLPLRVEWMVPDWDTDSSDEPKQSTRAARRAKGKRGSSRRAREHVAEPAVVEQAS